MDQRKEQKKKVNEGRKLEKKLNDRKRNDTEDKK